MIQKYTELGINGFLVIIFFVIFFPSNVFAQTKEDLFSLIEEKEEKQELLPKRMVFTQKIFWGERGLFRKINISPLNTDFREKELKVRRVMLKTHQIIGYATLFALSLIHI